MTVYDGQSIPWQNHGGWNAAICSFDIVPIGVDVEAKGLNLAAWVAAGTSKTSTHTAHKVDAINVETVIVFLSSAFWDSM